MSEAERFFDCKYAAHFTRAELSMLDQKAALYAVEPTYRETLYEIATRVDQLSAMGPLLRQTSIGLIRPDAIAHGKVADALTFYGQLGIHPTYAMQIEVDRIAVREIWRYQLTAASGARIRLLDLVLTAGPSVLTCFAADPDIPELPCTVLMADAKGPADVAERQGWELRSRLHSPNRIEVYIHCADEPADVVRDGGLLLGAAGFADAIAGSQRQWPAGPERVMEMASRAATDPRMREEVVIDPVFHGVVEGRLGASRVDRWQLIRTAAAGCSMLTGSAESQISDSGIAQWWKSSGLLDQREHYFRERTGWTAGPLADPLP